MAEPTGTYSNTQISLTSDNARLSANFSLNSTPETTLKYRIALVSICAALISLSAPVYAKGCLKGAAVGGVGGHVLGGHGLAGAAVGCAVGRHRANKADKADKADKAAKQEAAPVSPATPVSNTKP